MLDKERRREVCEAAGEFICAANGASVSVRVYDSTLSLHMRALPVLLFNTIVSSRFMILCYTNET